MNLERDEYKVVLFGDSNVGKTAFCKRLEKNTFIEACPKTIGVNLFTHRLYFKGYPLQITLQIWDFSGEDRFKHLFSMYLKGCTGGIFMFDLTNQDYLESFSKWMNRLMLGLEKEIPLIIVGNKKDLMDDLIDIGKDFNKKLDFVQCSVKTGKNMNLVLETLASKMVKKK